MPNPAVQYEMIAVLRSGATKRRKVRGAPNESKMIAFGKAKFAKAVIRYFPSKRGWRVLDIRAAINVGTPPMTWWKGQVRGRIYFPSEDAAVMAAIHLMD